MVILAELADHGGSFVNGSGYEVGILSVGCVPVASIENSNSVFITRRKTFEVSNEAMLIIDLGKPEVRVDSPKHDR